ncbi:hypothetical protein FOJ82_14930 [Tessaracoccus rhinocerotis]|uniref:EpsG family protein n=1 Tax=Tessaracoccus rhinocerotis TaxID=1689449 RepID=A0A553JW68_9ACTN|nr:EpsG family protein [Tessaracoccus rhinocerotis]TRY16686.1 hypothetical protein FOJ82_14930 [Tessaracoccus rhinocerotis]
MTVVLLALILSITAISLGIAFSGRRDQFVSALFIGILILLFAGNMTNPDYAGYQYQYELQANSFQLGDSYFEPGFRNLMLMAVHLGLTYAQFVTAVAIIGILLIHRTLARMPGAANYVYPLYLLFPFFLDVIQVRNFLVVALLVYATGLIVTMKGRKAVLVFGALIIVAGSMHALAFLYAPLVLLRRRLDKALGKWPLVIGVVGLLIAVLLPSLTNLLIELTSGVGNLDRLAIYLSTRARIGFLLPVGFDAWAIWNLWIAKKAVVEVNSTPFERISQAQADKWVTFTLNAALLCFIAIPLYVYSSNFTRIPRNLHILYYGAYFLGHRALSGQRERQLGFFRSVLIYTIARGVAYIWWPIGDSPGGEVLFNNIALTLIPG